MNNLPACTRENDIPCEDDVRPDFDAWALQDPDGFNAALYAEFADDYGALIADAIGCATASRQAFVGPFVDRMQRRLDAEIEEGRAWVVRWRERRELRVMY